MGPRGQLRWEAVNIVLLHGLQRWADREIRVHVERLGNIF